MYIVAFYEDSGFVRTNVTIKCLSFFIPLRANLTISIFINSILYLTLHLYFHRSNSFTKLKNLKIIFLLDQENVVPRFIRLHVDSLT